jgi:predicted dehydrogenase
VPFVYRFHPMVRELRARLTGGEVGRVHLAHGTYLQDWLSRAHDTDWRVDAAAGGPSRAFADIGSHWFELLEFVLDDRVRRLCSRFATVFDKRPLPPDRASGRRDAVMTVATEDLALVQFETDRGVLGSVVISQVSPGRKNALVLEISGADATARFDQEHPGSLWMGRRSESTTIAAEPRSLAPDAARHVVLPAGHPQGYLDCVDRFVVDAYAAIAGDTPEGLPTFADGRRAVVLADAALRSARADGRWVELP